MCACVCICIRMCVWVCLMLPHVAKHELWLTILDFLLPSSAKVCYTFCKLIFLRIVDFLPAAYQSETVHFYSVHVFLHYANIFLREQWLRITEFDLLWLAKWLLSRSVKVCYAFLKIDISVMRCSLTHLSVAVATRIAHTPRCRPSHFLLSNFQISPDSFKRLRCCCCCCRGAAARLMFTLIAQSPWHLKTKQINVEKKQAKQHRKKATMAMPQCFFSTTPAVCPVIMCR